MGYEDCYFSVDRIINKHPYLEQLEKKESVERLTKTLGKVSNESKAVSAGRGWGVEIYYETGGK
jgi:hypothetical protein